MANQRRQHACDLDAIPDVIIAVVLESLVAGSAAVVLGSMVVLTREVYRLKGLVENGLTNKVDHIEQRVDAIYEHLIE